MVFHWSSSDSKSLQVSRTRLRILAVLSNAVVWIVSTRPPTSKSSRPFNNPLVIVPKAPITIGTIVTFMFDSFFNSLARSKYLSFFWNHIIVIKLFVWDRNTWNHDLLLLLNRITRGSEKFIDWPRRSYGKWSKELYTRIS